MQKNESANFDILFKSKANLSWWTNKKRAK